VAARVTPIGSPFYIITIININMNLLWSFTKEKYIFINIIYIVGEPRKRYPNTHHFVNRGMHALRAPAVLGLSFGKAELKDLNA
jgi:hypothetical protein